VPDQDDDQIPEPTGPAGDDVPGRKGSACTECGQPLAADQRYCLNCGHRRGGLPAAVAGTLAAVSSKGRGIAAAAGAKKTGKPKGDGAKGDGEQGGWSWMPSPPAIAIAVIGMLALGVGLGSAMSEIASSAPISTILLDYPSHAVEAPATAEEPEAVVEEEEEPVVAAVPEETTPLEIPTEPLPEEPLVEPVPEEAPAPEEPEPVPFNPFEEESEPLEEPLPEVKHAFLIVLGEGGYEQTFGADSGAPYLSQVLPKKGELIPNYYGVTGGVLANEIALLSGQGPTPETAVNCPNYTAIAPATVSATAGQVEGNGCVYPSTVESLPTQLAAKELSWRAYVENMENGGPVGQPWRCRKPTLGGPDTSPTPSPGDQYVTWRNPVVYFGAIAESAECEKHDVGFELLTRDLQAKKKTPALSLIFPDACHSGGEVECEPGAPKGAQGATQLLKTLVPAIMASPAYEEGGLIMITSAEAPQVGAFPDPSGCCLAPAYPNLAPVPAATAPTTTTPSTSPAAGTTSATSTSEATTTEETEPTTTTYTEESVLASGGGGKVGLLMISPFVEPGTVVETEYANHFTLLKTLETMFEVEPLGYASEEEMPTLSPSLFKSAEEIEAEEKEAAAKSKKKSKSAATTKQAAAAIDRVFSRLLRSAGAPPARAGRHRGTS
jgi:phosphatidylinositol-3-phosphatase